MKFGNTIDFLTGIDGESGHRELLALVVWVGTAHANKLVPCNTENCRIATHILAKELLVKVIVTCWHRGVAGIETAGTNKLQSLVKGKSVVDIVNQTLQITKSCVTFVAMVDVFFDSKFLQQQHTTDTKKYLLLQTVFPITTIKGMSDGFVVVGIHLVVSIKKIQTDTTYVNSPDVCVYLIVHIWDVNNHRVAVFVELTLNGKRIEVLGIIVSYLLTIHRKALAEIAVTIQETDCAHINVGVRSFFHVITSKHTQTA